MFSRITLSILALLLIFSSTGLHARIINVPDDFETIQAGIDEAEREDTVLVAPGEYVENIAFTVIDIVVGSHFIIEGDEDFIAETVIDGDQNGSVVSFTGGAPQLTGFTIHNGGGHVSGGGIYCRYSSPILSNLIIAENNPDYGGGLYFDHSQATLNNIRVVGNSASMGGGLFIFESDINLQNVLIEGNEADLHGGGVFVWESEPILTDVTVRDNTAVYFGGGMRFDHANPTLARVAILNNFSRYGGGIETDWDSNPVLINVTVAGNEAERGYGVGGGIDCGETHVTMINSIVWGNEPTNINFSGDGDIEATYSDFEDDFGGEGNISEDPLFVDPDNGDYHLLEDSPCIDAGDPEAEPDPDGTRADMGAFPYLRRGTMQGTVLDHATGDPIREAQIVTDYGEETTTDDNGFFILPDLIATMEYDLTASAAGYNDSTLFGVQVGIGDTLDVTFRLLHPEIGIDPLVIEVELQTGVTEEFGIEIANPGNGRLVWEVEPMPDEEAGTDPWTQRTTINVGNITGDSRIEGVVFTRDHYYVTGANRIGREDGPDLIYVLDRDGVLVDTVLQPEGIGSNYGIRDMAWDGELIWGSGSNMIGGFTTEGELRVLFEGPFNPNRALAWDPDREVLWVSSIISNIVGVRRNGEPVDTLDRCGFRIYGLAYWQDDPDGYPLYVFQNLPDEHQVIYKLNPDTGDTIFVRNLGEEVNGAAAGAFITRDFDDDSWVFMDIANDGENDRIDVWQLTGITGWMNVEPAEGAIEADEDQGIILTLDANGLAERIYEGELLFRHNAGGGELSLMVILSVYGHAVHAEEIAIPNQFGISGVYPNPFNSTTSITFQIVNPTHVSLAVYDLAGRLVDRLIDEYLAGGTHAVAWQPESLSSGSYFILFEAGGVVQTRKVVLMR